VAHEQNYEVIAKQLKIMGHPTRLQILDMLRQGETCVCHIETALNKRQAYISQQLMVLRDAHLVSARKDGLQVYYRLNDDDGLHDLLDSLLGTPAKEGLDILAGCACVNCATVAITDIK
jgi:DNA-binding transcriptional ArsR family regulator